MIALVTGASGFVGRHLVAALHANGWQVVGAGRSGLPTGFPAAVEIMRGDILDDRFLREVLASQHFDAIFHLAGLNASATAMELYRANVLGTAALLDAARWLGRPELKIVLLGSSAQYGAASDNPITEESIADPVTIYGVSKACCDMMGRALFKETGQSVFRARAFNVVGPGQNTAFLQGRVVEQITEAEGGRLPPVVTTGDLSAYRDFIDVRDVAAGLIAIAKSGNAGEAYNLCSGRAVQTSSLVGSLVRLSRIPLSVETGGRKAAGVDVPYQRGSFKKLRCHTGWFPGIALERSLADALDQRRYEFSSQNVAVYAGAVRP
jgi:GDP-4-dehydro-6-deoxy-D-mannose reductase